MVSGTVSFEEFVEKLRSEVPAQIEEANKKVEGELPEILEIRSSNKQRSLLLNPNEARSHLKGMMEKDEKVNKFLDVVSSIRGGKVEITEVSRGHRDDKRDFIMKGRNPVSGVNVEDMRVLLGVPKRKGTDIRNEVTQAAFYKLLNLHVVQEKANLN
jgi:hypothetical protein